MSHNIKATTKQLFFCTYVRLHVHAWPVIHSSEYSFICSAGPTSPTAQCYSRWPPLRLFACSSISRNPLALSRNWKKCLKQGKTKKIKHVKVYSSTEYKCFPNAFFARAYLTALESNLLQMQSYSCKANHYRCPNVMSHKIIFVHKLICRTE